LGGYTPTPWPNPPPPNPPPPPKKLLVLKKKKQGVMRRGGRCEANECPGEKGKCKGKSSAPVRMVKNSRGINWKGRGD